MSERIESYQVCRVTEEAECQNCGNPIYLGETAYESEERVYCSRACAKRAARREDEERRSA